MFKVDSAIREGSKEVRGSEEGAEEETIEQGGRESSGNVRIGNKGLGDEFRSLKENMSSLKTVSLLTKRERETKSYKT